MSAPAVSVVVAAYNAESMLERAIGSAICQTLPPLEILVVDDASTDGTVAMVEALAKAHAQVRLIRGTRNAGPAVARNLALEQARGEWIAVLDADDAWRPDRLGRMLDAAIRLNADYVADNHVFFDNAANVETGIAFRADWAHKRVTLALLFDSDRPGLYRFPLGLMKPVVRTAFLREKALTWDSGLRTHEDLLFTAEALARGAVVELLAEPLYVYTTPIGGLSNHASPHSHTAGYAAEPVVRALETFLKRYGANLVAEDLSAAQECLQKYRLYSQAQSAKALRRAGRLAAYVGYVAARPRLLALLAQGLAIRAIRRARATAVRLGLASADRASALPA